MGQWELLGLAPIKNPRWLLLATRVSTCNSSSVLFISHLVSRTRNAFHCLYEDRLNDVCMHEKLTVRVVVVVVGSGRGQR